MGIDYSGFYHTATTIIRLQHNYSLHGTIDKIYLYWTIKENNDSRENGTAVFEDYYFKPWDSKENHIQQRQALHNKILDYIYRSS